LIDPQKGITVFWAGFIEVGKVDADPLLPILFLDEDRIRELVGIERPSNEALSK